MGIAVWMRFRGPLADSYPGAVVLVLLALTPYLVLSTAFQPLTPLVARDLGMSRVALEITAGMANAAYAFGTVGAVQLTSRLPARRVLLGFASGFVTASVLAAWAPVPGLFVAGRVLQGLCTGGLLISAVPPLVIGWPLPTLRPTAVVMNLGIFGAVALGPVVGGASAGTGSWRPLLWIVAGIGALALVFALLTYEDQQAQSTDAPVDVVALALAACGCAAAFFGVSFLTGHALLSPPVLLPLVAGVAMIAALLVWEYRIDDPLMPVEKLVSTLPVAGIVVAMCAGGASVALIELAQTALQQAGDSPLHAGMLFWPEFAGALGAAVLFGTLYFTRYPPLLAFAGLVMIGAGGVLLLGAAGGGDAVVAVGSGLVGLGTGCSVSPALFVAAWSLLSPQLPRVFALVELLRGVAAFLLAPLLLHLASTIGSDPATGLRTATWVALGLALAGALLVAGIYLSGGARPREPALGEWLEQRGPALESPPLGAARRPRALA